MIALVTTGYYTLMETYRHTKILTLDEIPLVWINATTIGEILIASHKMHRTDHLLAKGKYRLYEVKDEPKLTDLLHLELHVGNGMWQGYLLPTGLPTETHKRNRIIPTKETITKSF
jgi:hypothetical protein